MPAPTLSDKRWSIDLEKRIQEAHAEDPQVYARRYAFNPDSGKEMFVIDTPPPYPSGTWHIGAVAQYSMIDVIARSQRLLGKKCTFHGALTGMESTLNLLWKRIPNVK